MQQHLLPIERNALIFSLSHVFQTSYVVLISIDHVQPILSCAWFPAHWSSSGPDKKLQDKLANSSRVPQLTCIWMSCKLQQRDYKDGSNIFMVTNVTIAKLQFNFPYCQKKITLWFVSWSCKRSAKIIHKPGLPWSCHFHKERVYETDF